MLKLESTDRYARYVFSALVVLTASLAGLLVHASLGLQVVA
jgi:heme exporter protein D